MNSSARVQRSATGLPAALASRAASTARLAGVLAAEAAAEIGDDDADLVLADVERVGDLAADARRGLRGSSRPSPRRPATTPPPPPAAPSARAARRRRRTTPSVTAPPASTASACGFGGMPPLAVSRRYSSSAALGGVRRGLPLRGLRQLRDRAVWPRACSVRRRRRSRRRARRSTPSIALAGARSMSVSFAPYDGGRSTLPYSIPGRVMSDGYLCAPVTRSRRFGRGTSGRAPSTRSTGVSCTSAARAS